VLTKEHSSSLWLCLGTVLALNGAPRPFHFWEETSLLHSELILELTQTRSVPYQPPANEILTLNFLKLGFVLFQDIPSPECRMSWLACSWPERVPVV